VNTSLCVLHGEYVVRTCNEVFLEESAMLVCSRTPFYTLATLQIPRRYHCDSVYIIISNSSNNRSLSSKWDRDWTIK